LLFYGLFIDGLLVYGLLPVRLTAVDRLIVVNGLAVIPRLALVNGLFSDGLLLDRLLGYRLLIQLGQLERLVRGDRNRGDKQVHRRSHRLILSVCRDSV
jgi:hypothetical protein